MSWFHAWGGLAIEIVIDVEYTGGNTMNVRHFGLLPAIALAFSLGVGAASAQTTPETAPPATAAPTEQMAPSATPTTPKAKKPAVDATKKAAISKACSDAADKQGLKGTPRKKFRESCKRKGGPVT
ncbi:hypothetical protein [Labrys sp. LIt4]|uniref:hypothetical protein n=1 Tax=Labrys sp. LIt4 TaxID=2821355 RepID=UPI001FD85DF2|nr:hypothetical protein [Labrys sp. LIt4]